jgi:UV DNA damage repair endonuclease
MRISSELFPFASHDKYGYDLDYAAAELKVRTRPHPMVTVQAEADSDLSQAAGDLANKYGHRMTLHPGQVCGGLLVLFTGWRLMRCLLPSSPKSARPSRTS